MGPLRDSLVPEGSTVVVKTRTLTFVTTHVGQLHQVPNSLTAIDMVTITQNTRGGSATVLARQPH